MLKERISYYNERRGKFPSKTLVYKEGISDGMINKVLNQEVINFENALKELGMNETKLAYVTLNKVL